MSPYRRNIMVGLTVLVAMSVFGWMLLKFGTKTASIFSKPQIVLHFRADRADGLSEGSALFYLGVTAGRVTKIERLDDQSGVQIDVEADRSPPLPSNVRGEIRIQSLLGGASAIHLISNGPPSREPLESGAKIDAVYVGADLLPHELADTAAEIGKLSRQFRESHVVDDLDETIKTMNAQLLKAGQVMDSTQKFLADEKTRADLQASVANIRQTTETSKRIAANFEKFSSETLPKLSTDADDTIKQAQGTIAKTDARLDDVTKQLTDRLQQVSSLLTTFQSISEKIDKGQGSAGLLVNDPKLYAGLVDTTRELNATVVDLKRLVEQWEQEGVSLKMK